MSDGISWYYEMRDRKMKGQLVALLEKLRIMR
jgi:hypothetical protein